MQITKTKRRRICEIISIFVCLFAMALSVDEADEWPSGGYGLPKPRSGCPGEKEDGWHEGWRFQDMDDTVTQYSSTASSGIHMDLKFTYLNLRREKDVNRTFCIKRKIGKQTKFWPNGSYCIYKANPCPINMISGWVRWDDEDDFNVNKKGGSLPDGSYNKDTMIHYCCQNSGNWHDSIELPVSRPFYLLTSNSVRKPKYQMVKWAFSFLEYIVFDTNHQDNADQQGGQHIFLHGRKLYYCYYKDCRRKLTGPSGSFRSHPVAVDSMDPHSQHCSWSITVAETHVVSLKLKELVIPFCGDTFLKIYDGLNSKASLLGIFCGANAAREVNISSTANNVYVVSNSGSFGNGRNHKTCFSFVAEYSAENISHSLVSNRTTTTSTVSTLPTAEVKECTRESSTRTIIIIALCVGAGKLLIIVLLLVKLKRQHQRLKMLTPIDVPLTTVETSPEMLPIYQEPSCATVVGDYRDLSTTNPNTSAEGQGQVAVPLSGNTSTFKRKTPNEYKEPVRSPQYPIYTALDNTKRKNSDEDNYQKLIKQNSDYVKPAVKRQTPAPKDVKMGRNLPGYAELDQMKRETEESQQYSCQNLS